MRLQSKHTSGIKGRLVCISHMLLCFIYMVYLSRFTTTNGQSCVEHMTWSIWGYTCKHSVTRPWYRNIMQLNPGWSIPIKKISRIPMFDTKKTRLIWLSPKISKDIHRFISPILTFCSHILRPSHVLRFDGRLWRPQKWLRTDGSETFDRIHPKRETVRWLPSGKLT